MIKRIILFVVSVALIVSLSPSVGVRALRSRVIYYTVWGQTCVIGPAPAPGQIEGQWVRDCDGNLTGWGEGPFDSCFPTTAVLGELCPQSP